MISTFATNPKLTEQGFTNVFRMSAGTISRARSPAICLAERWSDQDIAILHDGQAYGEGLAEETKETAQRARHC